MTRALLSREDSRPVPELTRAKGVPGDGYIAVIYFTHGEPETYDPIGWINQFKEFDEQSIPFILYLIRPYFIYQLRNKHSPAKTSMSSSPSMPSVDNSGLSNKSAAFSKTNREPNFSPPGNDLFPA